MHSAGYSASCHHLNIAQSSIAINTLIKSLQPITPPPPSPAPLLAHHSWYQRLQQYIYSLRCVYSIPAEIFEVSVSQHGQCEQRV